MSSLASIPLLPVALKSVAAHKARFALTTLAVVLGVSFVVGTFVITDSLRSTFEDLSEDIAGGIDLYVRSEQEFGNDFAAAPLDSSLVDAIRDVDGVAAAVGSIGEANVIPLTADGEPVETGGAPQFGFNWVDEASLTQIYLVDDGVSRAPTAPDEFVMDRDTADDNDFVVGERYTVLLPNGPAELTLVGVVNFGSPDENNTVGATLTAYEESFALEALNAGEGFDQIQVDVASGADIGAVQASVQEAVDARTDASTGAVEVVTNDVVQDEQEDSFGEILDIFQNILLVFAVIILVVSAFIIYNTFSIVIGQRVQELGLLRAIGATGNQVTWSLIGEAAVVGALATVLGLAGGVGLAVTLRAILDAAGFGLPAGPIAVAVRTVVAAVVVGVGVTLVSAVLPALKARRIPPIAALRSGIGLGEYTPERNPVLGGLLTALGAALILFAIATERYGLLAFVSLVAGLLVFQGGRRIHPLVGRFGVAVLGLVLLLVGVLADLSTSTVLTLLGVGALLTFVGVNLISPLFARQVTSGIGRRWLAVLLFGMGALLTLGALSTAVSGVVGLVDGNVGAIFLLVLVAPLLGMLGWLCLTTGPSAFAVDGRIGTQNAGRSPRRTSSTAAALMIGLALSSMVLVLGASLKSTISEILDNSIAADWLIAADLGDPNSGFSSAATDDLRGLVGSELESVVAYRFSIDGFAVRSVEAPDGTVDYSVPEGTNETVDVLAAELALAGTHIDPGFVERDESLDGPDALWIHQDSATDRNVDVGDTITIAFGNGVTTEVVVSAIYDDATVLGNWTVDLALWEEYQTGDFDQFVTAVTAEGVEPDQARAAMQSVMDAYPQVEIQDREEFRESQEAQVDDVLVVVNVFLGLALVIALIGIANTLALSVFERTRELGLLRAVGMQSNQMRRMVRWEGAIIAVFGGLLGVVLGVVFAAAATTVIPESVINTFDVPFGQLLVFLVLASVAGIAAAAFPARRAGKLNVLEAISEQ